MYLEPHQLLTPLRLFAIGFATVAIGALLMLEAGRASAAGADWLTVERTGSIGAWSCLTGIGILCVAGFWAALS